MPESADCDDQVAVDKHSESHTGPGQEEGQALEQPLVLVVHQSASVVEACQQALEPHGFRVVFAEAGNTGVHQIYQGIPDLVIAGVTVPELNGYQLCRLIKNDSAMNRIPVLLLSDATEKMDRFWGMKAGADDCLSADEIEASLLKKVQAVLGVYERMGLETKRQLRASNEASPFNVRTRLNQILDKALVQSTLMVEFRSLADLVQDVSLLNYMLFSLLESLLEYDAAAIVYNDDNKAPRLLTVHLPEGRATSEADVERLTDDFFERLKGRGLTAQQLEMVTSEVIGTLEESSPPVAYASRYLKEFYVDGRLLGALCLYSTQDVDYAKVFPLHLVESEIRLLMKLRHLYAQAETLAITDTLTGLFNHRHFMTVLQREFKLSQRYGMDLSLVMVAVDHFRQLNEQWGHLVGDDILRHVAGVAEANFRNVDVLARFGGKYLVAALPKTSAAQAITAVRRFQEKVAALPLSIQDQSQALTVCCSLVDISPDMRACTDLIRRGEEALERARAQGENRLECVSV